MFYIDLRFKWVRRNEMYSKNNTWRSAKIKRILDIKNVVILQWLIFLIHQLLLNLLFSNAFYFGKIHEKNEKIKLLEKFSVLVNGKENPLKKVYQCKIIYAHKHQKLKVRKWINSNYSNLFCPQLLSVPHTWRINIDHMTSQLFT